MSRGTSPDLYIRYASISVFTPIARPGPNRNVQLCTATRALPSATREAAFAPAAPARSCLSVTTESRPMIPIDDDDGLDHAAAT